MKLAENKQQEPSVDTEKKPLSQGDLNRSKWWRPSFRESGVLGVLIGLCIIASIISPSFLQHENLINILRQISIIGIISVGMTFVILTAGIDLSVGSIIGVVGVICADMLNKGMPIPAVMIIGLLLGAVMGAINGLGITMGKIPAFIMTLGMMVAGRGIAMTYSNGQPTSLGKAASKFHWLGSGDWLGIPVPIWIFLIIITLAAITLKYSTFGRNIFAIGDNREAARLSGINVGLVECAVYTLSGLLAGLTALVLISRLTVGDPTSGGGMELDAIAMVVIGGTSLFGGEGGVLGTIIGGAIIVVIGNILNLSGISPFTQQIVSGAIIICAVLLERFKKNKN
jgi:ribose transport system permease protein